jgi:hypothetical protein
VEETAVNKSAVYVATAIVLGLAMTLVPALFFVMCADEYGKDAQYSYSVRGENLPPLLESTEHNHIKTVSSEEVEILAFSLVIASIVYVLFKRKTSKYEHVWPPFRQY